MTTENVSGLKPIVFYHNNCADGFGAAFAAWHIYGDSLEYVPMDYNKEIPADLELKNRTVYILDFSFPREVMDKLFAICSQVIWLDHHKTAFEMYGLAPNKEFERGYNEGDIGLHPMCGHLVILDNCASGAKIAWRFFNETPTPALIQFIDDYDRWQYKLPKTKEFNKALWAYAPWSFEFFEACLNEERVAEMISEGAALVKAHNQQVDAVAKNSVPCTLSYYVSSVIDNPHEDGKVLRSTARVEHRGFAVNCPKHLASDVGHKLATQSGTYGMCWFMEATGRINVSLRSNGDYDVSAIAKQFGGGGHKNAAGFSLPDIFTFSKFLF